MSLRHQVRHTAGRLEAELANQTDAFAGAVTPDQNAWLPQPASPWAVGLDGAYVHAKGQRSEPKAGKELA